MEPGIYPLTVGSALSLELKLMLSQMSLIQALNSVEAVTPQFLTYNYLADWRELKLEREV